jgi:hypothetical protein
MRPTASIEGRVDNNVKPALVYWTVRLLGIHMHIEYIRLRENKSIDADVSEEHDTSIFRIEE